MGSCLNRVAETEAWYTCIQCAPAATWSRYVQRLVARDGRGKGSEFIDRAVQQPPRL